ncbi:MAG: phage antirepressor KilAC domain-containing protein [Candidatus Omnitrophota bacterium]
MNDLIKIEENDGVQTVNARDLWLALESKQQFADWIRARLEIFIEGSDYLIHKNMNNPEGGRPSVEYHLTIDTAKHISMLERNERGMQIRQYFIEIEKKARELFSIPKTYAEALQLAANQAKEIEQKNEALAIAAPKVDFFDAVTNSKDAIEMKDAAKVLNIPGYGRNNLFQFLRDNQVLMPNNTPMQSYIDRGYFRVIEQKFNKTDGDVCIYLKTVVYQKGLDFIRRLIAKK